MAARDTLELTVREIVPITAATLMFELISRSGRPLPSYTAGAHIDLLVGDRSWRSYSLLDTGRETSCYRIAVQKDMDGRGGSKWLHGSIGVGATLEIAAPLNNFPLQPAARLHTLIAGGIGITPILSMVQQLIADDAEFRVHFCARREESAPFLNRLRAELGDRLTVYLGAQSRTLNFPCLLATRAEGEHVYVCGPPSMIEAVRAAASHWPKNAVHFELFQGTPVTSGPAHEPFEIFLAKSNVTLNVPPGKSILRVLLEFGLPIEYQCEEGICGLCTTPVVSGKVEHRDSVLTDEEKASNALMQVCVSRPLPGQKLVLDL